MESTANKKENTQIMEEKFAGKKGNKFWYLKGLRDGIPIAMGYFAVSFTLGITMKNTGITPLQGAIMSMTMLASAGQYAAITVIAAG